MMDWLILGCGYVGTRLARALLADGVRVRVCARNVKRLEPLGALGAEVHALDAAKPRSFGPALYGLRSPVVLYSIPPVPGLPPGEPLRRAADAALTAGAKRLIYLGSTAVYGETDPGETVDEDSPIAAGDPTAQPRIAEESAVETARLAGLSTVILRLAAIYGPGRGVRERLRTGSYQLVDDGVHYFSRVHVDDIVAIARAAADRAPPGALYCVADDHPSTQAEYADWLCQRLGLPRPPSVPSLQPGQARRGVRNRKVSNAKLKHELDYHFRLPTYVEGEQAIDAELAGAAPAATASAPRAASAPTPARLPLPASAPSASTPPAASAARTSAATPIVVNPFDGRYDSGASEYERYLKTAELLALQKPADARSHPDELFFQCVHQVEELWMKVMVHELGECVVHLDAERFAESRRALERVAGLGRLLELQLSLFESMLPSTYLVIRKGLGRGSGLDSPGFLRLNALAPEVWRAFESALARAGVALMDLYAKPETHAPLLSVAEGLVDFDAAMQRFKREHIMVVRRIIGIGIGSASLRGNPMDLLERSARLTYFPSLWAVRDGMFTDFKAGDLEV
jgi:tryptophan 2,3-dioxygenase